MKRVLVVVALFGMASLAAFRDEVREPETVPVREAREVPKKAPSRESLEVTRTVFDDELASSVALVAANVAKGLESDGERSVVEEALAVACEPDERVAFRAALALAPRLDERATAVLVRALEDDRPQAAFALRGSRSEAADAALVAAYLRDGRAAGAAAFALADRGRRLGAGAQARIRDRALADLRAGDRLDAAADVLGGLCLDEATRRELEALSGNDAQGLAARRALATAG